MPRTHTPPAKLDIRKDLARDALVLYADWQVTGSRDDAPVLIGKLASSLELVLQALEEIGL
jgi:hypothetical protein